MKPGPLLATGRDADIFECGPDLVLRRSRAGRSMRDEARIMTHVREAGYPVPRIEEISEDGTDLVMERIAGPSMVELMGRRPWTVAAMGRLLAQLHQRLHAMEAPAWLRAAPVGVGDRVVHLDLHPLNVIMGPSGPVVIDWANASRGDPAIDVALTWALVDSGEVEARGLIGLVTGWARGRHVAGFLSGVDRGAAAAVLPTAVKWKCGDAHLSASERAGMVRLARAQAG